MQDDFRIEQEDRSWICCARQGYFISASIGSADELWVTFGGRGARISPFPRTISSRRASALHVISQIDDWYRDFDLSDLLEPLQAMRRQRVVLAGVSMGGYGALKFSRAIDPDVVIAASPQTLVDDDVTIGHDDRFRAEWRAIAARAPLLGPDACDDLSTRAAILVVTDVTVPEDRWHIDRINARGLIRLDATAGGHDVLEAVRLQGDFFTFMDAAADADVARASALIDHLSETYPANRIATGEVGVGTVALPNPVIVSPGIYAVTASTTLNGVTVQVGGQFSIASGCVLTIIGPFEAPRQQVFVGAGTVVFADGAVDEIRPEWWGYANAASAAVNDAARRAARDSITLRGTVRFPAGSALVTDYIPINRSYIRFVGDARFGTVFVATAGAGDVTGIDGTMQPGFSSGSAPIDECQHLGIGVQRLDSQSATCSFDTSGRATSIPSGARGFIHRFSANANIQSKLGNSPIDYYESQTSGAHIDIYAVRISLSGDTPSTLRFGVVSDCTIAGFAGTSANGSSYKRVIDNAQGFTGISYGCLIYGADLRDQFWDSVETAYGSHAVDIIASSGSAMVADDHITLCVLDAWSVSGLRICNLPGGSRLNINQGYSAPGVSGSGVGPSVRITASSGVTLGGDFEAKGGVNYALHKSVLIEAASARFRVDCSVTGCAIGVEVDDSSLGHLSPDAEPQVGQPMSRAINIINGSSRVRVGGATIDGESTTTYGIFIDSTSTYNVIEPCNINPGSVTTPIYINGTAVTTTKSMGNWVDTVVNHNRVLPGTLDDGL